MSVSLPNLQI